MQPLPHCVSLSVCLHASGRLGAEESHLTPGASAHAPSLRTLLGITVSILDLPFSLLENSGRLWRTGEQGRLQSMGS